MYTATFLQDPDFIRSLYIVAFALFIIDLRLMNHPRTARRGNVIGAIGMAIAVIATLLIESVGDYGLIVLGIAIGTAVGVPAARSVKMTAMPQMVALFNGVGGGAVALISFVEYRESLAAGQPRARGADPDAVRGDHRVRLVLGLEHRLRKLQEILRGGRSSCRASSSSTSGCWRSALGCAIAIASDRVRGPLHRDLRRCRGAREHVRAADRRRGHAGRDLAAERLHRPLGGLRRAAPTTSP